MKTVTFRTLAKVSSLMITLTRAFTLLTFIFVSNVHAQEKSSVSNTNATVNNSIKKSFRVPAMRNRVYAQLARAQKLADEGDKIEGFNVLEEVQDRLDSLNDYERAMLWNFYGFMYYGNDDLESAIDSFEKVIAQQAIPSSLRLSTLYSLAQLTMQQQNYDKTLGYLNVWEDLNSKAMTANQEMLFAQVNFQNKAYATSLDFIKNAIELTVKTADIPKENWLILQRANYYQLKQPIKVTKVIEQLVRYYNKPKYWLQLSGMYGEIGEEEKQLATMESAWQAGYIVKSTDIVTLAQLYLYHGVPYKAAQLLADAIEQGVVTPEEKYLAMLAQAYIAAKDDELAIPVLMQAAEISDTGNYDAQLAQAYLNTQRWKLAIKSANKALSRGGIDRIGDMHLVIGMSTFNLKQFTQSLQAFKAAENILSSAKTATQWYKYVTREQENFKQLALLPL